MAAKMPELREHFLYRRVFLNRRSATFDLAVAGAAAAALARSPVPLIAALPYMRMARDRIRPFGWRSPAVAAADAAADLVGLYSMAIGSARHRSPLF